MPRRFPTDSGTTFAFLMTEGEQYENRICLGADVHALRRQLPYV